jgi:hypothetical protein
MGTDPAYAFVGDPCCTAHDFVFAFWIMTVFDTLLTSLFHILSFEVYTINTICRCTYMYIDVYIRRMAIPLFLFLVLGESLPPSGLLAFFFSDFTGNKSLTSTQ